MDISRILNNDKVSKDITDILNSDTPCTIILSGPSGRGKSFIAENASSELASDKSCCIYLMGDEERKSEEFYPLKLFVEKKDKNLNKGVKAIRASLEEVPYIGKGLKVLTEDYDFGKNKQKRVIQDTVPFKRHLDFSLHVLGLHRSHEKVVIICDGINEFDKSTIDYLTSLKEGFLELNEDFNISFLIISNTQNEVPSYFKLDNTHNIDLPPISKEQAKDIIKIWSNRDLSPKELDIIQSCSGGHLQLLKIASNYIKEANQFELPDNRADFYKILIDARLRKLKDYYERIKQILIAISESGMRSSVSEILCLLGEDKAIQELLKHAVQMDLLFIKDNYIHFAHSVIEDYAKSFQDTPKLDFYGKLGNCLRKLTPGDYYRRAICAQLSDDIAESDTLWALAAIRKMREGTFDEIDTITKKISSSTTGNDVKEALVGFQQCYKISFDGDIDEALNMTEQISNAIPKAVLAEKNYLKCENLTKKISKISKEEGLRLINEWEEIKEQEPEIWYRLLQLKIIIASELGLIDLALQTEAQIFKYFSERLIFDIHARSNINRINLFSEVLYPPEIAHKKMLQTEKRLTEEVKNEQYHKVIDLFISSTNLSSNSFLIDDIDNAIHFAQKATALMNEFNALRLPSIEAPISNLYLATLAKDRSTLPSIIVKYKKLYQSMSVDENNVLIDINYAGLLLVNEQIEEAFEILKVSKYIPEKDIDDNYYYYYYWCNYAIIQFLRGNYKDSQEKMLLLEPIVENISHFLKKYYVKHHQIIKEMMQKQYIKSYSEIKKDIEITAPIFSSSIWNRFKTGYLFTDIQIWTSS